MTKYLALGDLTQAEAEELNRATEAMRQNRMLLPAGTGGVDSYLQFLDDRGELFGPSAGKVKKIPLVIDESSIL